MWIAAYNVERISLAFYRLVSLIGCTAQVSKAVVEAASNRQAFLCHHALVPFAFIVMGEKSIRREQMSAHLLFADKVDRSPIW
jgi:hypothetical protein